MIPLKSKRFLLLLFLILLGTLQIIFDTQSKSARAKSDTLNVFKNLLKSSSVTEPKLNASVVPSAPAPAGEPQSQSSVHLDQFANIEQVKKADFLEMTEKVLRELPKKRELKELTSAEAHLASPQIKESALKLAQVAEILSQSPSLKPQALEFYQQCSLDDQFLTPVRALCLNRALRLYAELHHKIWPYDPNLISRQILELAKRL